MTTTTPRPQATDSSYTQGRKAAWDAVAALVAGETVTRIYLRDCEAVKVANSVGRPDDASFNAGLNDILHHLRGAEDHDLLQANGVEADAVAVTVEPGFRGKGWMVLSVCGLGLGDRVLHSDGSKLRCEGVRDFLRRRVRHALERNRSRLDYFEEARARSPMP